MSLSSAFSSALSGLTASARVAELISSNVANALTPGYARREADLSARSLGGTGQGVRVIGVQRDTNAFLLSERRGAQAGHGGQETRSSALRQIESAIGSEESASSLLKRIAAFDQSLLAAASRPESEARLSAAVTAAADLVSHITQASSEVQAVRGRADTSIGLQVNRLNQGLARIADLNDRIKLNTIGGADTSALQDQRQQQIDLLAEIVPLREVAREDGSVALYSAGGAALIDGRPSTFGFTTAGTVTEAMVLGTGLSGLTLNGQSVSTTEAGLLGGGTLAAQFALRDEVGTEAQAGLDALARDLVERFQQSGLDATRAPGDPGLFTDAGAAFVAANEPGLATRISLNAAVDPRQGGEVWRLRDGLGAAASGPTGDSRLITALQSALTEQRTPASAPFSNGMRSFSGLASDLTSSIARQRLDSDETLSFATARYSALQEAEQERGVDTDQEMQQLLLVEQAYAANARVMQALDQMLGNLMEI